VSHVVEDVACTLCGCVCDDLRLVVDGDRITEAGRACGLAEPWFLSQGANPTPRVTVDGRAASLEQGLAHAAEILKKSQAPLIYGLSRSSTDGQRAAVALADRIGATIDTTASLCHAPSIVGFQETGESTSSLGEIRNRSDLVIFWGCDPAVSHPRHFERYSTDPQGEFVPGGRSDRTVIVIDRQSSASSALSDLFLQVDGDRDFEALWTLRQLIRGDAPDAAAPTGIPLDQLQDLAQRMMNCRSGVVFFGLGLSRAILGHLNVAALLSLVCDLHRHTRFYARRLRIYGDVTGADSVLCWQTGYPFSVSLGRGYPRYNPGEFSAEELLAREEVDACLLVGSETVEQFSSAARAQLRRIPTIALDYPGVVAPFTPSVAVTTAVYGVHRSGTAYRMDEIPIPLKKFLSSQLPSDEDVLRDLQERFERNQAPSTELNHQG
jgi:formylmethanofuran dehydrogenase subunit B